ncbi:hypothetical protein [Nakamurella lactea]|uniref:hypothetical protein n=1 Tax=Nakamurella lactea TaxID=459515 RepID=UPI0004277765|nr:hypothetical protein [Nakamurella lactea]
MTDLDRVGFFRELPHGDADGPELTEAIAEPLPADQREVVANYLDRGSVLVATTGTADDVLSPDRRAVADISMHTDGTALWPGDLGYYVRNYGARVPKALLDRAMAGPPPPLTDDELAGLADEFLPPPPEDT